MRIGSHSIGNNLVVAPMAGVTDRPFRQLCKRLGAGMAISEMVTSNPLLRSAEKSQRRTDHAGEVEPIVAQIAGAEPAQIADAARYNVERGAQIIDINMGCPAKKVCNVAAGSALLQNEALVAAILDAAVRAVDVPVTLKIRTGWNRQNRNAVRIARIAEHAGIAALSVHGRTRECGFVGAVEYDTIREVKQAVGIPVIANGDVDSPEKARAVLARTGADAIMIGRAAQGRPSARSAIFSTAANGCRRPESRRFAPSFLIISPITTRFTARTPGCASRASTWVGTREASAEAWRFAMSSIGSIRQRHRSRRSAGFSIGSRRAPTGSNLRRRRRRPQLRG